MLEPEIDSPRIGHGVSAAGETSRTEAEHFAMVGMPWESVEDRGHVGHADNAPLPLYAEQVLLVAGLYCLGTSKSCCSNGKSVTTRQRPKIKSL